MIRDRQDLQIVICRICRICDVRGAHPHEVQGLKGSMDECMTRLWAGAEAEAIGRGGLAIVSRATGLALNTVKPGRNALRDGAKSDDLVNVRRRGAGGRNHVDVHPELLPALKRLVDPATRGEPVLHGGPPSSPRGCRDGRSRVIPVSLMAHAGTLAWRIHPGVADRSRFSVSSPLAGRSAAPCRPT